MVPTDFKTSPAAIGRLNSIRCSPWTIRPMSTSSSGSTLTSWMPRQTGTIANTGVGPPAMAAYSSSCSWETLWVPRSYVWPIRSRLIYM